MDKSSTYFLGVHLLWAYIRIGRHTTVLGGIRWCVMVPQNGSAFQCKQTCIDRLPFRESSAVRRCEGKRHKIASRT